MVTLVGNIKLWVVCFVLLSPWLKIIPDHATKMSSDIGSLFL